MKQHPQRLCRARPPAFGAAGHPAVLERVGLLVLALTLPVALLSACGGSGAKAPKVPGPPPPDARLSRADRAFVLDPLLGFPLSSSPSVSEAVLRGYRALTEGRDPAAAGEAARDVLDRDPGFAPALVLLAQIDFYQGRAPEARDRLRPVAQELPGYAAAQALLGRTAEAMGNIPEAYGAYLAASPQIPAAAERAEDVRPRAVEIVILRFEDALARQRTDTAELDLELLTTWDPDGLGTLLAQRRLALAREDSSAELEVLRRLVPRLRDPSPEESSQDELASPEMALALEERRGDLELDIGDAQAGLEVFRRLHQEFPEEPRLARRLKSAEFQWRMTLLPAAVGEIRRTPEISRSELAALLYWLVPGVRQGSRRGGLIASDILDDPHRQQIARVINHRLLTVDEALHRFHPDRPAPRFDALSALLRVLAGANLPAACLGGARVVASPSEIWVCEKASRCGLLESPSDCLPRATLGGSEASELIRRALATLGGGTR